MKLLLDENIANKIKEGLIRLGFKDTIHINNIAKGISDKEVFELAKKDERIIITGDDDFKANNFKHQIPIIWITPKARYEKDICYKIKWILDNIEKHNINLKRAFISIRKNMYSIEYKNKDKVFAKIKKIDISFNKIKKDKLKI